MRELSKDIVITPRKPHFDLSEDIPSAFSIVLPAFEQFFIAVIFKNKKAVNDEALQKQMISFCTQEGNHSTVHRQYNQLLLRQGYTGIQFFERLQAKLLSFLLKNISNKWLLATTAAGEHVTSFMGHDFLSKPKKWSTNAHLAMTGIWKWHAIEEIEHKAVCFDTYQESCGAQGPRRMALFLINLPTLAILTGLQFYLLGKDGLLWRFSTWRNYFKFMLGRDGFMRLLWREYLAYFKGDFHPWQNDDRDLLMNAELRP